MTCENLISLEQAKSFLREKLYIDVTDDTLQRRGVTLLHTIMERYHTIPFQNLSMMGQAPHTPTLSESVEAVLTNGVGGLCWTVTSVLYLLLKVLGYDVYPVSAAMSSPEAANHLVVIAENVERHGDRFVLETGLGHPTLQAIPLDFEWESPIYDQSFLAFKYRLEGDTYIRLTKTSRLPEEGVRRKRVEDGWAFSYYFQLKVADLNSIMHNMEEQVYKNDKNLFWNSLRMLRWKDKRAICIKDFHLLMENESGKLESVSELSEDLLPNAILRHFPEFSEADIGTNIKKIVSILRSK